MSPNRCSHVALESTATSQPGVLAPPGGCARMSAPVKGVDAADDGRSLQYSAIAPSWAVARAPTPPPASPCNVLRGVDGSLAEASLATTPARIEVESSSDARWQAAAAGVCPQSPRDRATMALQM
eukprot:3587629-Prymnesium_polylepis.1